MEFLFANAHYNIKKKTNLKLYKDVEFSFKKRTSYNRALSPVVSLKNACFFWKHFILEVLLTTRKKIYQQSFIYNAKIIKMKR